MTLDGRIMTLEEFQKLPELDPPLEFRDTQVSQRSHQAPWEGALQIRFAMLVNQYAEPRRLAMAFPNTRATFGGGSLVATVGVCRSEKIPRFPNGSIGVVVQEPWDLVMEFCPDGGIIHHERVKWFLANGVKIVLCLDADTEILERFASDGSVQHLLGDELIDLECVLPGFKLTPQNLFSVLWLEPPESPSPWEKVHPKPGETR
jgi:hypothetical protein